MSSVAEYQKCVRNLIAARQRLRGMLKTINAVSTLLQGWKQADPNAVVLDRALENWPSQVGLVSAVEQWKQSQRAVLDAWDSLPITESLCLIPPDELKFPE